MLRRLCVMILAVLGVTIVCYPVMAAGSGTSAEHCNMITLNHISPQHLMMLLGLCSEDDFLQAKDISWNRSDKPASSEKITTKIEISPMMPDGIKTVISVGSKKSLLVIGDNPSVEQFKTITAMLDIPLKQIQVATKAYEVPAGSMNLLSGDGVKTDDKDTVSNKLNVASVNLDVLNGLKGQLENEGAKSLGSPIIATLNNIPAFTRITTIIPVSSNDGDTAKGIEISHEVRVRPRINADGTIHVIFSTILPRSNKSDVENARQSTSPLQAVFTAKSGESVVLYETVKEGEDWLLFIVTPTIVKDTPAAGLIN